MNSALFLDVDATVAGLKIDPGDCLHFLDGHSLTIGHLTPGYLVNNGHLLIQAQDGVSSLVVNGGLLKAVGSGFIELTDSANSRIEAVADQNPTFINATTIHGAGVIGDGHLRVMNEGEIVADRWLELMQIVPGSIVAVNHATMRAINGAILRLHPGEYDNLGGLILAEDESYVELDGTTITGGTVASSGSGIARAHSSGVHLKNVTFHGYLELAAGRLSVTDKLTNHGIVEFLADNSVAPQYPELYIPAGVNIVTLAGDGEMRLLLTKIFSDNPVPPQLINGAGHTLRGEALLGYNTLGFKNLGTVVADRDNPILIDPPASQVAVNEGTLRAEGLGGLVLTAGTFRNNGLIEVLPGSRCFYSATAVEANLSDGILAGGTWRIDAGSGFAYILIPGPGAFFNAADVTLSGQGSSFSIMNSMLVNSGRFAIDNGRNFFTQGSFFTNEGELSVGASCVFTVNGPFTQSAGGTIDVELGALNLTPGNASINVNSSASLAGTLFVRFAGEFQYALGQQFHLLSASTLTGEFENTYVPAGMALRQEGGNLFVDVISVCVGDLNSDQTVNSPDLIELLAQWGQCDSPAGYCTADFNGDGLVNTVDLHVLIAAWGPCTVGGPAD